MTSHNAVRTLIRTESCVTKNVYVSQQACDVKGIESLLDNKIFHAEKFKQSPENIAHLQNLKGARAIIWTLLANIEQNNRSIRQTYMSFIDAFTLFLSHHEHESYESIKNHWRRKEFKEFICHPTYGIPVYILGNKFVVLRSNDADYEELFEELLSESYPDEDDCDLNKDFVGQLLDSMDSAWDKKVVKYVLASTRSRVELARLGIGDRINKTMTDVTQGILQREECRSAAVQEVKKSLENKQENIKKKSNKLQFKLDQMAHKWSTSQKNDVLEEIELCKQQVEDVQTHLSNSNSKAVKEMNKRMYYKIVKRHRIGMRKGSSGRPKQLDETDERFVLECIESKSTAHGRRHDAVMYTGKRVKKRDFLKIANFSRVRRGLKPIRSATTVYNRGRPRNKRSTQSKLHLGLALFCTKKPPKLQDKENVLTHYQRAFKRNILHTRCGPEEKSDANLFISRDDKAYICPGTGTGMTSARSVVTIQPSNLENQRVLPKYDWPTAMVNATPGVSRIFNYDLTTIDGKNELKMIDDNAIVFNRPKFWVGSGGTVWASEFMQMRYSEPLLFTSNQNDKEIVNSSINKSNIMLMDMVKLYDISCQKDDVFNISFAHAHRLYEQSRLNKLSAAIHTYKREVNKIPDSIDPLINTVTSQIADLLRDLTTLLPVALWPKINKLKSDCQQLHSLLKELIPTLKSRVHEFTDGGPGVGVTNYDVKFRLSEIVMICDLDYLIRHHLANDDSSHNEVERIQSYVGDAICDGGSLEWEYKGVFDGLTDQELREMSFEELEQSELQRMEYNAFKVCDELTNRIDGAPMQNGFMKASTSLPKADMFFDETYLKAFLAAAPSKRNTLPGYHYFTMLQTFITNHFEVGEKYLEYLRSPCKGKCQLCPDSKFIGPECQRIPKPMPDYSAPGYHYLPPDKTPSSINNQRREIDDFQPRVQIKRRKLESEEEIQKFSEKFIVDKTLLRKYLTHLRYLELKQEKRGRKNQKLRKQQQAKSFKDYDWEELVCSGKVRALTHHDLDKYLQHFSMEKFKKLKKKDKVKHIQRHVLGKAKINPTPQNQLFSDKSSDESSSDEENASDSDDDLVLNDNGYSSDSDSEAEGENSDSDDGEEAVNQLFTVTRSGRTATTYKRAAFI